MSTSATRNGQSLAALRADIAAHIESCAIEGAWYWATPARAHRTPSIRRETISLAPNTVALVALGRRGRAPHAGPTMTTETVFRGKRLIECAY